MIYCANCGKQVYDNAKFCGHCGNSIDLNSYGGLYGEQDSTMELHAKRFIHENQLVRFVNEQKIPQERIQNIIWQHEHDSLSDMWILYWWE